MPLLPLFAAFLVLVLAVFALPFSLLQRYRAASARRRGRRWLAAFNAAALAGSCTFFVWVAALTNFWAPRAFLFSLAGLAVGALLGFLGLLLTRWENLRGVLHFTPNRWLILFVTGAVALRLLYGIWRAWHAWNQHGPGTTWLAAAGVAGSMGAGAVVLGYSFVYHTGIFLRLRRA